MKNAINIVVFCGHVQLNAIIAIIVIAEIAIITNISDYLIDLIIDFLCADN